MLKSIFIMTVLVIFGCDNKADSAPPSLDSNASSETRLMLLGEWCGEQVYDDGTSLKWLVNRLTDGTYKVDFTEVGVTGVEDSWGEFGVWGISYPIYFTAVRGFTKNSQLMPADLDDSSLYDAYRIESITEAAFNYKSYASGSTFAVTRPCTSHAL